MAFGWLVILLYIVPVVLIATVVLQWLWNITMPELFRLPTLRYWQAVRLLIIAGFLLGDGRIIGIVSGS